MPPPLPDQLVSEITLPLPSKLSVVPPTAITFAEVDGQMAPAPESPLDAKKAAPLALVK